MDKTKLVSEEQFINQNQGELVEDVQDFKIGESIISVKKSEKKKSNLKVDVVKKNLEDEKNEKSSVGRKKAFK